MSMTFRAPKLIMLVLAPILIGMLAGCSLIAELTEQNTPLVETFRADPDEGFTSLEVLLEWRISDLDGDAITCTFDYGDGNTAELDNCDEINDAFYTYEEPGSYIVTLTADDGGAQASRTEAILVTEGGAASSDALTVTSFTAQPDRGTAPFLTALNWTLQADNPVTCTLSFGDSSDDEIIENCQEITNAVHTFEDEGGYRVILEVTDDDTSARASLIVLVSEASQDAP